MTLTEKEENNLITVANFAHSRGCSMSSICYAINRLRSNKPWSSSLTATAVKKFWHGIREAKLYLTEDRKQGCKITLNLAGVEEWSLDIGRGLQQQAVDYGIDDLTIMRCGKGSEISRTVWRMYGNDGLRKTVVE